MKRRSFIQAASMGSLGFGLSSSVSQAGTIKKKSAGQTFVTVDDNKISFFGEEIKDPAKILFLADTHLHLDDDRGLPYRQYSARMARGYHTTRHFRTGQPTNPEESFKRSVERAVSSGVDLLVLGGDIFSFPSEAAIEWVHNILEQAGVPYLYVAGNHDWHYEGMEGSMEALRGEWAGTRLKPLYQGKDPMMAAYDVKGIRFLAIDNSTYQISGEQLAFFRAQAKSGVPLVLIVHIPLYAPGRQIYFGCGNPNWGAAADKTYQIERRPIWPDSGHTATTMAFYKEVFSTPNLISVLAGHIHRYSMDVIGGKTQFVTDDNASGAFLDISLLPLARSDQFLTVL